MKTLCLFLLLAALPLRAEPKAGEVRTVIVRDAAGQITARHVIITYPTGSSVTIRDASGQLKGTAFLPKPELRK